MRLAVDFPKALLRRAPIFIAKAIAVHNPLAFMLFRWAPFCVRRQRSGARIVVLPLAPFFWAAVCTLERGAVWLRRGPGFSCGWRRTWTGRRRRWRIGWFGFASFTVTVAVAVAVAVVAVAVIAVSTATCIAVIAVIAVTAAGPKAACVSAGFPRLAKVGIFILAVGAVCWLVVIADVVAVNGGPGTWARPLAAVALLVATGSFSAGSLA